MIFQCTMIPKLPTNVFQDPFKALLAVLRIRWQATHPGDEIRYFEIKVLTAKLHHEFALKDKGDAVSKEVSESYMSRVVMPVTKDYVDASVNFSKVSPRATCAQMIGHFVKATNKVLTGISFCPPYHMVSPFAPLGELTSCHSMSVEALINFLPKSQ